MSKGDQPIKTGKLKIYLSSIWMINATKWNLIPIGKGYYNVNLTNFDDNSRVFFNGFIFLKLGVFWISQLVKDFNPYNRK